MKELQQFQYIKEQRRRSELALTEARPDLAPEIRLRHVFEDFDAGCDRTLEKRRREEQQRTDPMNLSPLVDWLFVPIASKLRDVTCRVEVWLDRWIDDL